MPPQQRNVSGQQRVFTGTDSDAVTGATTLGLWMSNLAGNDRRLLVSHGDATAIGEPSFSDDGQSIYFTAQHAHQHELHRFTPASGKLDTLYVEMRPLARPTVGSTSGGDLIAVQVGACAEFAHAGTKQPDVAVIRGVDGIQEVSLQQTIPQFAGRSLTPVGWRNNDQLAVLVRDRRCSGPGDLVIISSLTTSPTVEVIAGNVSEAAVQRMVHESTAPAPRNIVLPEDFAVPS
jgi:hypothetical protein